MPGLQTIDAIRAFSRFYTTRLGVVGPTYLGTEHTLSDARVIFELDVRKTARAADLVQDLGIDPSYLSRIITRFGKAGLLTATPDPDDGRSRLLSLTARGREEAARLAVLSRGEIGAMIERLSEPEAQSLEVALGTAERLLSKDTPRPAFDLRQHRPGDMGWIVESQASFYTREHGWNENFEALVAEIVSQFLKSFNPRRERVWIAERDGARIGSIVLADGGDDTGKLRLLYVDEAARGLGLGNRLVEECIGFAASAGYRRISLWTNHTLTAARSLYTHKGFRKIEEAEHAMFGPPLVGETWELELSGIGSPSP
ncbi:bifunctional helix-turn-helix transcriptional regulator/GNAT family N-acetyltransferase [Rhizobium sp. C4]|uniref:bifunctional helix-turn-helix transcriptional regulator/GNAT family N-acetyltransferase n=1 Tax=Rhizobium sp. C4 TaxID=1349800 RepID=UPI001E2D7C14|nr:bifunctional helix-turn-helix transcriptional regulator/GNAT family N-acetyltransferase [Rhizobium sp. C4]MCD2173212.1 bifunctional helix-turn-helix transcriptional regulator/GNAT family N-acetyltransferase [Rhizobium sp. C4]